jgi:hypothetical protein
MKSSSRSILTSLFLSLLSVVSLSGGDLRIVPRVIGGNEVSLTFDCTPDTYYQILVAGSLKSGTWAVTNMGLGFFSRESWTGSFPQARLYLRVRAVPQSAPRDEDGDGLDDVLELRWPGFNPLDPSDALRDTEGDGMPDGWEFKYGLKPSINDAGGDLDGDGLANVYEYLHGTHPLKGFITTSENGPLLSVITPGQ